jgi:hypothetical protein
MILLEHREYCFDCGKSMDCTLAGVFSTKAKAIEFMKKNKNYDFEYKLWWWVIYSAEVDYRLDFNDLEVYSKKGSRLKYQPCKD